MTPKQFTVASKYYADVFYSNVIAAARLFFRGHKYVDLCCGPGDLAKRLRDYQLYPSFAVDDNPAYVRSYKRSFPGVKVVCDDLRGVAVPQSQNALFTNASGHFDYSDLVELFDKLHAKRLIANFLCIEDLEVRGMRDCISSCYAHFDMPQPCPGTIYLNYVSWERLTRDLVALGWRVDHVIHYFDFKPERLCLLSR